SKVSFSSRGPGAGRAVPSYFFFHCTRRAERRNRLERRFQRLRRVLRPLRLQRGHAGAQLGDLGVEAGHFLARAVAHELLQFRLQLLRLFARELPEAVQRLSENVLQRLLEVGRHTINGQQLSCTSRILPTSGRTTSASTPALGRASSTPSA